MNNKILLCLTSRLPWVSCFILIRLLPSYLYTSTRGYAYYYTYRNSYCCPRRTRPTRHQCNRLEYIDEVITRFDRWNPRKLGRRKRSAPKLKSYMLLWNTKNTKKKKCLDNKVVKKSIFHWNWTFQKSYIIIFG